jgi:hypothetical protein
MKTLATITLTLAMITAASAQQTSSNSGGNCLKVDDVNNPTVILSGRITKDHRILEDRGIDQPTVWNSYFLKLDTPLREDNGGGCGDVDEIAIMTPNDCGYDDFNNQHVTIEGKLDRFPSALAYPSIFIDISKFLDEEMAEMFNRC